MINSALETYNLHQKFLRFKLIEIFRDTITNASFSITKAILGTTKVSLGTTKVSLDTTKDSPGITKAKFSLHVGLNYWQSNINAAESRSLSRVRESVSFTVLVLGVLNPSLPRPH